MPGASAIGEFEASGAPLGPFWGPQGPSGALRAPGAPGALGALGAPGALTPWPIPHKKKVEFRMCLGIVFDLERSTFGCILSSKG